MQPSILYLPYIKYTLNEAYYKYSSNWTVLNQFKASTAMPNKMCAYPGRIKCEWVSCGYPDMLAYPCLPSQTYPGQ